MLANQYGRIVNLGADSVRNGLADHAAYNAAKGGRKKKKLKLLQLFLLQLFLLSHWKIVEKPTWNSLKFH